MTFTTQQRRWVLRPQFRLATLLIFMTLGCMAAAFWPHSDWILELLGRNERVLIASQNLYINMRADPENTTVVSWPKERIPEGSFRSFDELLAAFDGQPSFVAARIYSGEPVLRQKVSSTRYTVWNGPTDHRVISLALFSRDRIDTAIVAGDYVELDLVLCDSHESSAEVHQGTFRIFTVDHAGDIKDSNKLTLLVHEDDVESVLLALHQRREGNAFFVISRGDAANFNHGKRPFP